MNLYSQVFFSGRFSKFSVHRRKSKIGSFLQKSFSWPWNSVIYTYLYCENNPLQWKMKRSWKEYELLSFSFSFDVSYILVKGEASKEWSRLCFFWQFTSCPPMVVSWFFFLFEFSILQYASKLKVTYRNINGGIILFVEPIIKHDKS